MYTFTGERKWYVLESGIGFIFVAEAKATLFWLYFVPERTAVHHGNEGIAAHSKNRTGSGAKL